MIYPNAVQLAYERHERPLEQRLADQTAAINDPHALATAFMDFVRGDPLSEAEGEIVAAALHTFATAEEVQ